MMQFKELREKSEMNLTEFAAFFNIPYRTVQNWEYGNRECPAYLIELMIFRLEHNEDKKRGR